MSPGMLRRRDLLSAGGVGAITLMSAPAGIAFAAAETRRCFVDSVRGSDDNDGSRADTPAKTLLKVALLRPSPGWVGLARDSRFTGTLRLRPGMIVEAYGAGAAPPIIDAAIELRDDPWTELGPALWAYTGALRRVHRLLVDGRAIGEKRELTRDDPTGSWAWIAGRLQLRSNRHPSEAFGSIRAINRSCIELIGADASAVRGIAAVNGVHGILGQRTRGATVEACSAAACAHNGFYLADDVSEWTVADCRSERNGGAGFALNYGAANCTIRNSQGNRNAIDGCQFSEGCGTGHSLIGCEFSENDIAGVNCKEKKQKIARCRMSANGEAGVIAQINTELLDISDSVLVGNNRADNGTMNLALEDHAWVRSTRNIFICPYARAKPAVNARLIQRSALESTADCFVDHDRGVNLAATIRAATAEPASLSIVQGSIFNALSRAGRVIDCRGAANLTLAIHNTAIVGISACVAYESSANVATGHNCYFNRTGGPIIEVGGPLKRQVTAENLRGFAAANGVETGTIAADPHFANPASFDLSLAVGSPARAAGQPDAAKLDVLKAPFGSPPNIGAVADRGDLNGRLRP